MIDLPRGRDMIYNDMLYFSLFARQRVVLNPFQHAQHGWRVHNAGYRFLIVF